MHKPVNGVDVGIVVYDSLLNSGDLHLSAENESLVSVSVRLEILQGESPRPHLLVSEESVRIEEFLRDVASRSGRVSESTRLLLIIELSQSQSYSILF